MWTGGVVVLGAVVGDYVPPPTQYRVQMESSMAPDVVPIWAIQVLYPMPCNVITKVRFTRVRM